MKYITFISFILLCIFACNNPSPKNATDGAHAADERKKNHLAGQSSPYLLQHVYNPVDWYPWGEEALKKAKEENKLMIISVGYSACHWCHVMEHESFEDSLVASVMNENFVCIKVDREERPDIDDVYMTACHLTGRGSCGWPLNAFALPDGRPFWAGTYFPKNNWLQILDNIQTTYTTEPEKLTVAAEDITKNISRTDDLVFVDADEKYSESRLRKIARNFVKTIDMEKGGRKANPRNPNKFPMPNNYQFLLEYQHLSGSKSTMQAIKSTLNNMANGGIYDHLGGGFARYSTDPNWKVPHFEKMMYDNGQLMSLYSFAYQKTKKDLYKQRVYETLDWVEREMTSPEGGFYSSLDADSEGEEGKFYVWEKSEIDEALGEKNAKIFKDYYTIKSNGNWEHDKNILHITERPKDVAKKHDMRLSALEKLMLECRNDLLKIRDKRIRPGLDDKILTSWNALMLKGYADAYRVFGEQKFLDAALKNADFLLNNQLKEGNRLNRNYKDGNSVINAFLDDYALLIDAFVALYQATFDEKWLNKANDLTAYVMDNFYDEKSRMFFYTSSEDAPLVARKKELSDNVIPASNSVMAKNLFHLGTYLYKDDYLKQARDMMNTMIIQFEGSEQPSFYSNWCSLLFRMTYEPYEVAIIGDDFAEKRKEIDQHYLPNALLLGGKTEGNLELLENKLIEDETRIYVCKKKVCKLPVNEVDKALKLME